MVATVIVLTALAGCGGGGGKTKGETFATTAGTTTTIGAGAPKSPTGGPTTSTTRPPDLTLSSFQTPSGNIGCELVSDVTRCDIREHSWALPPKPADCELDWGQGIEFSGVDKPSFVCAGDTALDSTAAVLPYGRRARQGSTVCDSEQAGVTCTNEASGQGFFLSRDSYRIF